MVIQKINNDFCLFQCFHSQITIETRINVAYLFIQTHTVLDMCRVFYPAWDFGVTLFSIGLGFSGNDGEAKNRGIVL